MLVIETKNQHVSKFYNILSIIGIEFHLYSFIYAFHDDSINMFFEGLKILIIRSNSYDIPL